MVGKSKKPTKAEARRMDILKHDVGCIACRMEGLDYIPPDIHHIVDGGRRLGHSHTVPLCPWHHRGRGPEMPGPSLARNKRKFIERYGAEPKLLKITNKLVAGVSRNIIGGDHA